MSGYPKKMLLNAILAAFMALPVYSQIRKAEAEKLYKAHCSLCHRTGIIKNVDKSRLLGPPVNEVMYHVKERYPIRVDAIRFMFDYVMKPEVQKALCASMDRFGMMPSMKGVLSGKELRAVLEMMFERFPDSKFAGKEKKERVKITFGMLDRNGDGYVSPEEFREFRARRNGIDPGEFRADLYFEKVDMDRDGKMSPEEFKKMRKAKSIKRHRDLSKKP